MTPASSYPGRVAAMGGEALPPDLAERLSLCEALDRLLNKGAVVAAEAVVSVAGVDLLYLQLRLLLTSVATLRAAPQPEAGFGRGP